MCGRFVLRASPQNLQMLFELDEAPQAGPRYNIAPTQPVLAVRTNLHGGLREATHLNWGLIPFWAKDPKDRQPDDKRPFGDCGGKAFISGGLQVPALHRAGRRIL